MPKSELTLGLCNYARPQQLHTVIDLLKQQSCPPDIFVWNNNPAYTFQDDRADWVINSNRNEHTRHVVSLWQQAGTRFVGRMDDDLYPGDTEIIADAVEVLRRQDHDRRIVGAFGVRLFSDSAYEDGQHVSAPRGHGQLDEDGKPLPEPVDMRVDLIKGRFMILRQEVSHLLSCGFDHVHSDLYVSTTLAGRHRHCHTVAGCFFDRCDPADAKNCKPRLVDFPEDQQGYCAQPSHMRKRDELAVNWAVAARESTRVRPKPVETASGAS